jgi:hypothetical protein
MAALLAKEPQMHSSKARALGLIGVVVIAVVLLVVLRNDGDSNDLKPAGERVSTLKETISIGQPDASKRATPTIVIRGGEPVGGIMELEYNAGDQVHFKVKSDVSDEVHVHGYDLMKDVKAGGTIAFDFPATIEGVFEAELEGRKEQIVELRVNP